MIVIDMKKPEVCARCPCVYWITSGKHEGKAMCCVMEYQGKETAETLVEEYGRPEDCPMREVGVL